MAEPAHGYGLNILVIYGAMANFQNGRMTNLFYRIANLIAAHTRERLPIEHRDGVSTRVGRSLKTEGMQACLIEFFCSGWSLMHPSSENGYIESINAKLRDELLNGEIFYTLLEAKIILEK